MPLIHVPLDRYRQYQSYFLRGTGSCLEKIFKIKSLSPVMATQQDFNKLIMHIKVPVDGMVEVFTPFITKNGKRIYRKDGKVWHFWAKSKN